MSLGPNILLENVQSALNILKKERFDKKLLNIAWFYHSSQVEVCASLQYSHSVSSLNKLSVSLRCFFSVLHAIKYESGEFHPSVKL